MQPPEGKMSEIANGLETGFPRAVSEWVGSGEREENG
jgi:hypothetical protein